MKIVTYKSNKDIYSVEEDLMNMITLAGEEGYLVDMETMYDIWLDYSNDYSAGWLYHTKEKVVEAIKEKGIISNEFSL